MKRLSSLVAVFLSLCGFGARAAETTFVVKYLSAENVYLNGGQADGLAVGDHLFISSSGKCRTEIEVVFVAEHSASCKMLTSECPVAAGDKVDLVVVTKPDSARASVDSTITAPKPESVPKSTPAPTPKKASKPVIPNLSGSFSVLYYHWNDQSSSNLDFSQMTTRLNLKARRLFGQDITFSLRSRGRYDQRDRAYSSTVTKNAWENRIWEFAFSYENPNARTNLYAGRILSRRISSAGYLDGLLLEQRVSDNLRVGFFGGAEPQWAYAEGQLSLNKGGGYVTYLNGEPGKSYLEQSLAAIGQYHGANVSRELISSQGRYSSGARWGYYHTAEFDLNRGWRKDRTGKAITLSSMYVGTYFRFSSGVRLNLSYDNRQNYWTYETKSTVDSLFDDHLRQGGRAQLDLTLPLQIQTSGSYGINRRTGDPAVTKAYSLYLSKSGLVHRSSNTMLQYSGFRGPFERGDNYSIRVSDNLVQTAQLAITYGVYDYTTVADDSRRKNNWFEFSAIADLTRRYFLLGSVESDRGDDIKGLRLQTELGYRF